MNKQLIHYSANKMAMLAHQLLFLLLTSTSLSANTESKTSHDFGNYTVHYSVFNSTVIQADVASAHQLKRAGNLAYINIAVVDNSDSDHYGMAAQVSGRSRNLLQQQQLLRFIAIKEQTATYYLAPIYYNNEDIYHFDITVIADKQTPAKTFTFTKTLYIE